MRFRYRLLSLTIAAGIVAAAGGARADEFTGDLFFTTFSGGENVWKTTFDYLTGVPSITYAPNVNIASTSGADGLLFAPNGNLLVSGQDNNHISEITTAGAAVTTATTAGIGSYHLDLSAGTNAVTGGLVYSIWNGGSGNQAVAGVPIAAGGGLGGAGTAYTVQCGGAGGCSTDIRGLAYDSHNGTYYYGTAPDDNTGEFGTAVIDDTLHTVTLSPIDLNVNAHGITFDPFTNTIITSEGTVIDQFDESGGLLSSFTTGDGTAAFDQSAADGKGHLFVASNDGNIQFLDYTQPGNLIGASAFSDLHLLADSLDDIAPLSGAGSQNNVPEPSTLGILGVSLAGLRALRRRRRG